MLIMLRYKHHRKDFPHIMVNKLSESKIWKAIAAVASSIITNLLTNLLSHDSYVIQVSGTQYIISDDSNMEKDIFYFVATLLLFFVLWGIFSIIISVSTKIYNKIKFRKIEFYSRKHLVNTVILIEEQAINLSNILYYNPSENFNIEFAKLKIRTLATMVSTLHAKFIPHNKQKKLHMKDNFRHLDYSSIININSGISKYEFLALIELLQNMVNDISSHANGECLMEQDCRQMATMLNDLNDFVTTLE